MIIVRTPLRISFAGGGTDLRAYYRHGYGSVISTAIDKYMYVMINRTFDHHIRVIYSKVEYVESIPAIQHNLAREAMQMVGISGNSIDIAYMGDVLPAQTGSGLGASSSLSVGILNALHACRGERVSAKTLAEEACRIEIEILGRPMGKQDQYAAAFGGFNYIRFNQDESVSVEPIVCDPETKRALAGNLLMFYTGLKGTEADNILKEQEGKTPQNRKLLESMVALADQACAALKANDLASFGEILHEGWVRKQKLASNITNPTIDDYYARARKAGAAGGKLLGSGGGGFLLLYCAPDRQAAVRQALSELREAAFNFEPEGSKIVYMSDPEKT